LKITNIYIICLVLLTFTTHWSISSQEIKKHENVLVDSIFKYYRVDSLKTSDFIKTYISSSKLKNNYEDVYNGYHIFVCFYFEIHENQNLQSIYTDSLISVAKKNNLKIQLLKGYHLQNDNLRIEHGYSDERIFNNIFKARRIAKEINSKLWECKFNQELAQFYMFTKQWDKSLVYLRTNLSTLKKIWNEEDYQKLKAWGLSVESSYLSMSELFLKKNDLDSAKFYNKKTKTILDTLNTGLHQYYKFLQQLNELEIHLADGNIQNAEKSLSQALLNPSDYQRESDIDFYKKYYTGIINFKKNDYEKAIQSLESIDTVRINFNERIGVFQDDLYKTLYKSFLHIENIEKADYYFEKHLLSINNQMESNNNGIFNLKNNEITKYNKEVILLNKQKSNQKAFIIISLFLFVILTVAILKIYLNRQRQDRRKLSVLMNELEKTRNKYKEPTKLGVNIKNKEISRIIEKLEAEEEAEYYLRMDCTASNLSKKINTNTTYLSKIINSYYKKNFTAYINDLRIDYVLDRLKNDFIFRRYTIQSIANEIGFKSKESFNSAFKKRTGVLPTALIRELEKKNDSILV